MKVLVQRVTQASVEINGEIAGSIGPGILALIGITQSDTSAHSSWLANKLINLRIFEDAQGKLNQSLVDIQGAVLIISQFTLYADCTYGRRPSFIRAASPEIAIPLYEQFIDEVRQGGVSVATGVFGAAMKVSLVNDGPVTIMLERESFK